MSKVPSQEALVSDLVEVKRIINEEWLLANMTSVDWDTKINKLQEMERLSTAAFALELQRLLAHGSDGHALSASLYPAMRQVSARELPFTLEAVGDRYIAIAPSSKRRNQLWNPEWPWVVAIDGVPVERWIEEASVMVPRSHTLAVKSRSANLIRFAGYFRTGLGLEDFPTFKVDLENRDGKRSSIVVKDSGTYWSSLFTYNLFLHDQTRWRITPSGFGYLHLAGAPGDMLAHIVEAMPNFRDTRGLLVDLRGNDGGTGPDTLSVLGIWLAGRGDRRHVAGFERRREGLPDASNYFVVNGDTHGLSAEGQRIVTSAIDQFQHQSLRLSKHPVSDRCFLITTPTDEPDILPFSLSDFSRIVPLEAIYDYSKPVFVLVDRHCFSSGEILAAGLQALPNVKVVGERTRGGSGSPEFYTLPATQLQIVVASERVYFTKNSVPLDGQGILPDVFIELDLQTVSGPEDAMLAKALLELEAFATANH